MKTKIFGGIAIVVIALAVAFNVSLNTSKTNNASLLALANVEALASESSSEYLAWGVSKSCPGFFCPNGGSYTECEVNGRGNACTTKGDKTCTCGTNCNPCI